MKKILYEPIISANEHLEASKNNPNRVRGVSRDANNHVTNIPEMESREVYEINPLAEAVFVAICSAATYAVAECFIPWARSTAYPWLCSKISGACPEIKTEKETDIDVGKDASKAEDSEETRIVDIEKFVSERANRSDERITKPADAEQA